MSGEFPWEGTIHEWLRARLLEGVEPGLSLKAIERSQWGQPFITRVDELVRKHPFADLEWEGIQQLMRNRMVLGFYRYGAVRDPSAKRWDNIGSARNRAFAYMGDGNLEHLIDVLNLCMIESIKGPRGNGSRDSRWAGRRDITSWVFTRAVMKLTAYLQTGNLWRLVEASTICVAEFVLGSIGAPTGHSSPVWMPNDGDDVIHTGLVDETDSSSR